MKNKIIDFIEQVRIIANQGGISEKTSNHNVKGSKSLETVAEQIMDDLGFPQWRAYNHLQKGEDPDSEFLGLPNKHLRKEYFDRLKNYLFDTLPKDGKYFVKDNDNLIGPGGEDCFILQPGGTQYSVDMIVKYKGYLIYFEFKTGGGSMPKYNDRFPAPSTIVLFVSSHKGKTMKTGEVEQIDLGYYRGGPKKGLHRGYKERKVTIPNPFLKDKMRVFFQGDIVTISNYSKFPQVIERVNAFAKQEFEKAGFDRTVNPMGWRPIMNPALGNINRPWEANGVVKTCEEREQDVIIKLNEL